MIEFRQIKKDDPIHGECCSCEDKETEMNFLFFSNEKFKTSYKLGWSLTLCHDCLNKLRNVLK